MKLMQAQKKIQFADSKSMKAAAVELAVIACSQKLFLIIAIARFIESLAEKKVNSFTHVVE